MVITTDPPIGMSISKAATQAGVSERTLYALANQGKLPGCRRIGKRLVVHRATFEAWLRDGVGE